MKKVFSLCVITCLILCLAGCFWTSNPVKGIRIVGIRASSNRAFASTRGAGTIMRDRYLFSWPENSAAYMLVAEDLDGNILTEGVEWSLTDNSIGYLKPQPSPNEYIQEFVPTKIGETIVTARNQDGEDIAQIVVYPGWGWNSGTFPGINQGFVFSRGEFTINENEADIWWPGDSKIRFEVGYWTDRTIGPSLDAMETITTEGKNIIPGPVDYHEATDTDGLFLVQTRNGAIYAAIVTAAKLIYKPTPLIPAP